MKKRKQFNAFFIIMFFFLVLYTLSLFIPLSWAIMTSLKDANEYMLDSMGIPNVLKWSNYQVAVKHFYVQYDFKTVRIGMMLVNSIIHSVGCSLAVTLGNCVTAYCCAKFSKFKISGVYTAIVIFTLALPIVGSQPSEIQMFKMLGCYDSILGIIICNIRFHGLYYLVFLSAFRSIPKDYSEAAYIDGAGNFKVFFRLMLPFVSKMFFTVALIQFIQFWNDYQTPLIYLPTHPTLAYGLFKFSNSYVPAITSTPMKMAGCMVLFLPIFVVFCLFNKRIMGNIMIGGVKE